MDPLWNVLFSSFCCGPNLSRKSQELAIKSADLIRPSPAGDTRVALASIYAPDGFSLSNATNFVRGLSGFSLPQTEPIQGNNSGPFWNGTGEGQQYLQSDPTSPQGVSQNGFPNSFNSFHLANDTQGQGNDRSSYSSSSRSQWNNTDLSSTGMDSVNMSRYPSQDSVGAQSQRTTQSSTVNSYDQGRSTRMYPSASQMSFHMSSARSDVTGRSSSPESSGLYTATPQMDLQVYDNFSYQNGEDMSRSHSLFHRDSTSSMAAPSLSDSLVNVQPYGIYTTSAEETFLSLTSGPLAASDLVAQDAIIFPSSTGIDSPTLWENGTEFLDSRGSSPLLLEDTWSLPPPRAVTLKMDSPLESSPVIEALSPKYLQEFSDTVELPSYTTTGDRALRKPIGPRPSKVASDLAAASRRTHNQGASEASDEFKLVGRSSLDQDNTAREHPLYHNVTPHADGLYHCPWEKEPKANCQHRPEKLKCNYDKFVDSHLKPYKCKVPACKELQFSSTACLLRHEREAHAMHGHGDKPFLCTYDGCERGVTGNGFPRHWNLRDHMKRVHNDPGQPKSNASGSPPPSSAGPAKSRKRKAGEQDSIFVEKSQKRVASPPVVIRQIQGPSLVDRYHEQMLKLQETVKRLQNPANTDNMDNLRTASDCLKVMAQTTLKIREAPIAGQIYDAQSG